MRKIISILLLFVLAFILIGCPEEPEEVDEEKEASISAIKELIQNEYKLLEHYKKVNESFGGKPPFSHYETSQMLRIEKLENFFKLYQVEVPENHWKKKVKGFKSLKKACIESYNFESNAISIYDHYSKAQINQSLKNLVRSFQQDSKSRIPFLKMCSNIK